ncbi:tRNA (adenosine(37)-N6)-dimethylallyltransferase MiaA [Reichenbachiella versicolor]|uniref:tRNA (adenosine(37)-N6)-dimethylallyltransferase MiaA n=1 Tax=Reichenbachiella versicolor TaxID=1821036 RepID=UPI000D6E1461|nr:tRNA (adenosine(37)-N6)-dimethylallyltransferase MiaA [Reichenbachiella versicolor]
MITILGPTASGKTGLATAIAARFDGEIISADSRQVYRNMNLGTGKDLDEYVVEGKSIPYHIIDIHDPGYEYNVFEFQSDFYEAYNKVKLKNNLPILCGGTGMYIDSVLKGYKLVKVPDNVELRNELKKFEHEELIERLSRKKQLHNSTDTSTIDRTIRAIEIATYIETHNIEMKLPKVETKVYGLVWERGELKKRITQRLKERLNIGMVAEVEQLISNGTSAESLKFYGLEYKFLVQYIEGEISYNDMYQKLNSAIHQFAKRQMTWFRRMEKQGIKINWIDGKLSLKEKIKRITDTYFN